MKCLAVSFSVVLVTLFTTNDVRGDEPVDAGGVAELNDYQFGSATVKPTPEMWFYMQERNRQDDPKIAKRERAERRAKERQQRIAAMKWFGYSNQRPRANPIPVMGTYSASWYGSWLDANRWVGYSMPTVIVLPDGSRMLSY